MSTFHVLYARSPALVYISRQRVGVFPIPKPKRKGLRDLVEEKPERPPHQLQISRAFSRFQWLG